MSAKKFFFFMFGVLLISAGVSVYGIVWADGHLQQNAQTRSELLAERDALAERYSSLQKASNVDVDTEAIKDLITNILPSEKQQENLISNIIYNSVIGAGISANSIRTIAFVGSGEPNELSGATVDREISGVYYYPFTLTIENITYTSLLELFEQFETNQRFIQINQLQIAPDKDNPGEITSVSLSLRTFIKP